jgi:hypothetical protein
MSTHSSINLRMPAMLLSGGGLLGILDLRTHVKSTLSRFLFILGIIAAEKKSEGDRTTSMDVTKLENTPIHPFPVLYTWLFFGTSVWDLPHVRRLGCVGGPWDWGAGTMVKLLLVRLTNAYNAYTYHLPWTSYDHVYADLVALGVEDLKPPVDCPFPTGDTPDALDHFTSILALPSMITWYDDVPENTVVVSSLSGYGPNTLDECKPNQDEDETECMPEFHMHTRRGLIDLDRWSGYVPRDGYVPIQGRAYVVMDGDILKVFALSSGPGQQIHRTRGSHEETDTHHYRIRLFLTSLVTALTLDIHMAKLHIGTALGINEVVHEYLPKTAPARRLLSICSIGHMEALEMGSHTLLYNGFACMFNLTAQSIKDWLLSESSSFPLELTMDVHPHAHDTRSTTEDLRKWLRVIRDFCGAFLTHHYPQKLVASPYHHERRFLRRMGCVYDMDVSMDRLSLLRVCTAMFMANVIHRWSSNPNLLQTVYNPFALSTTLRIMGDAGYVPRDLISNQQETMKTVQTLSTTTAPARLLGADFTALARDAVEVRLFKRFQQSIAEIDVDIDSILHPSGIYCSIRW